MRGFALTCLSVLLPVALTACSTALDKSYQRITVETPGARDAVCTLENRDFKYVIRTPKELTVTKTTKPLNVDCVAPGNRYKSIVVTPEISDAAFLNLGTGLLPGLAIDHATASMYLLPDVISVDFSDVPASRMPLPAYQELLRDNPMLMELEEFRPGRSALQRDRYEKVPQMQKIDRDAAIYEEGGAVVEESSGYGIHDKAPTMTGDYYGASAMPSTLDPSAAAPTSLTPSGNE